ncbi:hypothetical protein [Butyrivibrio sp. VCD2006]|uniref:hypothetical protein n=1 Tax=Butyrivibrio sp. VCD2006 TaxID=1280664 RepID=UPI000400053F|nr:hypothetical protein [Butyrivibrio sp. VCD2006]
MNNKKLAVIFPGMGYHSDKPLLYFSKRIARENSYEIIEVNYKFPHKAREIMNNTIKMQEAFETAASQIKEVLGNISFEDYSDDIFIGKSIGGCRISATAPKVITLFFSEILLFLHQLF